MSAVIVMENFLNAIDFQKFVRCIMTLNGSI